MLEKDKTDIEVAQDNHMHPDNLSESRRRLMRAGLAAAPVLMTLKSRSVLATGGHSCLKPSAFSSLQAASMQLSHTHHNDYACYSHGYWKRNPHPAQYYDQSKSFFLAVPQGAPPGSVSAGFSPDRDGQFQGKKLHEVLRMGGGSYVALARHTVGTFLTAVANSDDSTKVLLTTSQCRMLWSALAVDSTWSPFPGASWNLADTLAYFNYIYGP